MATLNIDLPDNLAKEVEDAGLLEPDTIQNMFREQLRQQAGKRLRGLWTHLPEEELTPKIEQEIVEEIRAYRAEQRSRDT